MNRRERLHTARALLRGDPLLWPLRKELDKWLKQTDAVIARRFALRYVSKPKAATEAVLKYLHAVYPLMVETNTCRACAALYNKVKTAMKANVSEFVLKNCNCVRHRAARLLLENGYGV